MLMGHEKDPSKTSPNVGKNIVKDSDDISAILNILDISILRTNPFGANVSADSSYKRAERICAALHLVTNHVPEGEPLRVSIRQSGLDLLRCILEMRMGFRGPVSEKGQEVQVVLRRLISYVRLLAVSGYISAQNASALSDALDDLGNLIVISHKSGLAEQVTLSREDLTPPAISTPEPQPRPLKPRTPAPRTQANKVSPSPQSGVQKSATDTTRSERIMDILKVGGVLGIKDISLNLPQYSEKMIQRELAELVDVGRVQKSGEKRWSRYQIVS